MLTCKDCSKFGKVQREPPKPKRPGAARGIRRQYRPVEPVNEVLENYNEIIRMAREKKDGRVRNWEKKYMKRLLL